MSESENGDCSAQMFGDYSALTPSSWTASLACSTSETSV